CRVELADAGEARRERDVAHGQPRRLDQDSRGLRPLRPGEGKWAGPEFGRQQAADLALLVAELLRETRHALTVDNAVGDQPHRPGGEVRPDVPLRRAGRGVRAAPLARAEAVLLRGGGRGVEADVLALRRHRRARRAAVNTCRGYGDEEHPVEPGVL